MHLVIGFAVLVGLIAFAFGNNTAQRFVQVILLCIIALTLAAVTWVVITGMSAPSTSAGGYGTDSAKTPEETPNLNRICAEWRDNPNDAPRMCFAILDKMGR